MGSVRSFEDWVAVRSVLIAIVVADAVGGLVIAMGTIQGTVNTLGWGNVVLYALLAVGALLFVQRLARSCVSALG